MAHDERSDDARERKAAEAAEIPAAAQGTWPPEGWVTNREAARILGVSLETLTCGGWKWHSWLRGGHSRCVRIPVSGGRCNIYELARIEQIIAAREEASRPQIPEGFVDSDGAARMFGLSRFGWKNWVREGRVRFGQTIPSPVGARRKVYAVADLERLREELFGEDKLYKDGGNTWHVPAGFVRRDEAWERFGVGKNTWERWEREGTIACGERIPGGPKLYKVEDVERLLEEYGTFCPPYPDPERPGAYRVPLGGRGIKRREAIVDADVLPLIEGKSCTWATSDGAVGFVAVTTPGTGVVGGGGVPLRRLIMGVTEPGLNVRHVNGDPLDCRRENLVIRTVKQRCRNAKKAKTHFGQPTTSRFKGVYWESATKRWRACIHTDKKKRYLGRFRDEIAAAEAYDEAARELFGEHARLNFPDGVDAFLAGERAREGEDETRAAAA
jgi:transposase